MYVSLHTLTSLYLCNSRHWTLSRFYTRYFQNSPAHIQAYLRNMFPSPSVVTDELRRVWSHSHDHMIIWIWLYGAFTEANISCTLINIMSTWCLVFCEFESFYTNLNQLWIRTHLLSSLDHFHQADVSVLFLFHNKTKGRKILSQQDKWKRKSSNHRVWSKSFFEHFHVHVFTLTAVNNQNQVTVRPHI